MATIRRTSKSESSLPNANGRVGFLGFGCGAGFFGSRISEWSERFLLPVWAEWRFAMGARNLATDVTRWDYDVEEAESIPKTIPQGGGMLIYKVDDPKAAKWWRPSIFMPRWASR